jgi:hypothetical protein
MKTKGLKPKIYWISSLNMDRHLMGMGELNPYWKSSMNVRI